MNKFIKLLMSTLTLISLSLTSLNLPVNASEVEEIISIGDGEELFLNDNGEYHFGSDPTTYPYTENAIIEVSGNVSVQTIGEVTVQKIREVTEYSSLIILEDTTLNVITEDEVGVEVSQIYLGSISETYHNNIFVNIEAQKYGTIAEYISQFNGTYISKGSDYGIVSQEAINGGEISTLFIEQKTGTLMSGIATGPTGIGASIYMVSSQGATFSGKALNGIGGIRAETIFASVSEKLTVDEVSDEMKIENVAASIIGESKSTFGIYSRNQIENIGSTINGITHNGNYGIETAGIYSDGIEATDRYDDGQGSPTIETEKYFEASIDGSADVGVGILVNFADDEIYPGEIRLGGTTLTATINDGIGLFASSIEALNDFVEVSATAKNGYGITLEKNVIAEDGKGISIYGISEGVPSATNRYVDFMKTAVNSVDAPTAAGLWIGQNVILSRDGSQDTAEKEDMILHGSAPLDIPGSTGIEIYANKDDNIEGDLSTSDEKVIIEAKGYIGARIASINTYTSSEVDNANITTYTIEGYKDGLVVTGGMNINGSNDLGEYHEDEYLVDMDIHAEIGTGLFLGSYFNLSSVYMNVSGGSYAIDIEADNVDIQYSKVIAKSVSDNTIAAMNITSKEIDTIGYINFHSSVVEITGAQYGLYAKNMMMATNADGKNSDGSYKMRLTAIGAAEAITLTYDDPTEVSEALQSYNSEITTIATNIAPDTMEHPNLYSPAQIIGNYTSFKEIYNKATENPITADGYFVYTTSGNIDDYTLYDWTVVNSDTEENITTTVTNENGLAISDTTISGELDITAMRVNDDLPIRRSLPKDETIKLNEQSQHTVVLTSRINDFTVMYNLNGGSGNVPATQNYTSGSQVTVTDVIPTKANNTFVGWSDGTTTYQSGTTFNMPNNNVILSAQWEVDRYQVTYDLDGGSGNVPGTNSYAVGENVIVDLVVPTKLNATFLHWTDGTTTYIGGNSFLMPANNVVLTAVWMQTPPTNTYTVSYNLNGGEGNLPQATNYLLNSTVVVDATIPTKKYNTFLYWTDGVNNYNGNETFLMPANNVILSAVWSADSYTVSYDLSGGAGDIPNVMSYVVGAEVTITSSTPTKPNYTFVGWKMSDTTYIAGNTFNMPAEDVVLVAIWQPIDETDTEESTENGGQLPTTGTSDKLKFVGFSVLALCSLILYVRKRNLA